MAIYRSRRDELENQLNKGALWAVTYGDLMSYLMIFFLVLFSFSIAKTDKTQSNSWAACLARIFEVYPLVCPDCNLEMKPVAVILNDKELVRLLTHMGLPAEFPKFKPAAQTSLYEHACGPPDEDCQLYPRVDYEAIDPAPVDD